LCRTADSQCLGTDLLASLEGFLQGVALQLNLNLWENSRELLEYLEVIGNSNWSHCKIQRTIDEKRRTPGNSIERAIPMEASGEKMEKGGECQETGGKRCFSKHIFGCPLAIFRDEEEQVPKLAQDLLTPPTGRYPLVN